MVPKKFCPDLGFLGYLKNTHFYEKMFPKPLTTDIFATSNMILMILDVLKKQEIESFLEYQKLLKSDH